jgi:hypothetical protein
MTKISSELLLPFLQVIRMISFSLLIVLILFRDFRLVFFFFAFIMIQRITSMRGITKTVAAWQGL